MAELKKLASKQANVKNTDKPLLREVAYRKLKNAIQDGDLQSGEPLYEIHLSEMLQISRTPVREALQQLVLEGLVKNMPNRAMTVAAPSMEELLNVLHIRSLIDPEIVRLVAGAVTNQVIEALQKIIGRMQQAAADKDRIAWGQADTLFHETLSEACPNAILGQFGLQMRNRIQLVATDTQTTSKRLIECTQEHALVVDAIAKRDAEGAKAAMQQHIQCLRESFFQRLMHM